MLLHYCGAKSMQFSPVFDPVATPAVRGIGKLLGSVMHAIGNYGLKEYRLWDCKNSYDRALRAIKYGYTQEAIKSIDGAMFNACIRANIIFKLRMIREKDSGFIDREYSGLAMDILGPDLYCFGDLQKSEDEYMVNAKLLSEYGARVYVVGNYRAVLEAFYDACKYGNLRLAKLLLENVGEKAVNRADYDGRTLLFYACFSGNKEVVELLLGSYGADVNAVDNDGLTPLHAVVRGSTILKSREEFIELLLKHGADANAVDNWGETPLHVVCDHGFEKKEEFIKLLLKYGADVNKPDKSGKTPLHIVAKKGSLAVVKLLLKYGADVNKPDENGKTPLYSVCSYGSCFYDASTVSCLFVENGAEVSKNIGEQWSSYHFNYYIELVKEFDKSPDKITFLQEKIKKNQKQDVKNLLRLITCRAVLEKPYSEKKRRMLFCKLYDLAKMDSQVKNAFIETFEIKDGEFLGEAEHRVKFVAQMLEKVTFFKRSKKEFQKKLEQKLLDFQDLQEREEFVKNLSKEIWAHEGRNIKQEISLQGNKLYLPKFLL